MKPDQLNYLVKTLSQGNAYSFKKLFDHFSPKLYGFAYKMSGSQLDAEGVVQNTFLKIWESRELLSTDHSFESYLFKICRNDIINLLKRRIREKMVLKIVSDTEENNRKIMFENEDDHDSMIHRMEKLIQKIPERRRQIFILHRIEGLTYKEIAGKLNISVNTVDTQIRHAMKFLRDELSHNQNVSVLVLLFGLTVF